MPQPRSSTPKPEHPPTSESGVSFTRSGNDVWDQGYRQGFKEGRARYVGRDAILAEPRMPILDQGERDDLYHECCESWGGHSEDCAACPECGSAPGGHMGGCSKLGRF